MTALINSDIAAIEAALAEAQDLQDCECASETLISSIVRNAANPARLRRVLDTMCAMGEALEACLPSVDPYSRERAEADTALAAYRGTKA